MPHGGARPNSGPKKGLKHRKTVGAQIAVKAAQELEKAREHPVTKATVDAYEKLCECSVMFFNQAVEQYKLKSTGAKFDEKLLNEMIRDARDTFGIIVKYQRPSLKALFISDPMGILGMAVPPPKQIGEATPFPSNDPAAAARAYQKIITAAYTVLPDGD